MNREPKRRTERPAHVERDDEAVVAERRPTHIERHDEAVVADERATHVEREIAGPLDAGRSLRWGPIIAGVVTSFSVFVLLSLLAVAVGLGTGTVDGSNPDAAATIAGSIIALASFFLGGFVAAWSAGLVDPRRGALDGFLVWSLWLVLLFVAGGLGLGAFLGEAGGLIDNMRSPDLTRDEVLNALSTGAVGTFLALLLAAAAAALGGVIGTRDEVRRRVGRY